MFKTKLFGCLLCLLIGSSVVAQEPDKKTTFDEEVKFPTAKEIIENNILARGGYELLDSRQAVHHLSKGTTSDGRTYIYQYYQTEGKFFSKFEYNNGSVTRRGVWTEGGVDKNGKRIGVAWEFRDQAFREMSGEELQDYLRLRSKISSLTEIFQKYKSIEFVSSETIDDQEHYKLRYTDQDGRKIEKFYNAKTWLLRRKISNEAFNNREYRTTRDYLNWERCGEYLVSKKQIVSHSATNVWTYETQEYTVDPQIPKGTFDLPSQMEASWAAAKRKKERLAQLASTEPSPLQKTEAVDKNK